MTRLGTAILILCAPLLARAGNAPEGAQRDTQENIVPKLDAACGFHVTVRYDAASLKEYDKDIRYDQTGGDRECNEPLRYLYYACRSPAGRAATKVVRELVCRGTPRPTGSVSLSQGIVTVERANEEPKPFVRAMRELEAIFKLKLALGHADPYYDEAWNALRHAPNPVTSTKTYCMVNGDKVEYGEYLHDPFCRRKEDATVRCWKDGALVTDLTITKGKKTGFLTSGRDKTTTRTAYKDDLRDGEERTLEDGRPRRVTMWAADKELWQREYHPNGKLDRFSKRYTDRLGGIHLGDDGRVYSITCSPEAKADAEMKKPCGFEGAATVQIYDGTGKITRVQTYKDGVLQKEGAGDSNYAARNEVAYKDGKKHGPERVLRKDGTLAQITTWDRGVQDGKETFYADDGKKVVKEIEWKAGLTKQVTELYLNGNPKHREIYDSDAKRRVIRYWDTGKVREEGNEVVGERRRYRRRDWCRDGAHKSFHESGQLQREETWTGCELEGTRRVFYADGKPADVEVYAKGVLQKAKRWDVHGALTVDEEYEADGSRKLKR